MKCKVLNSTIVYRDKYYTVGTVFDAKDEDVEGLVEGGFVKMIDAPKEAEVIKEPAEKPKAETVEEAPKAEEKPAEKPEAKGGKRK